MSNFNYSLGEHYNYNIENALLWGNFSGHCREANGAFQNGKLGKWAVHTLIALTELLPVIGQIASLFERFIITTFSASPQRNHFEMTFGPTGRADQYLYSAVLSFLDDDSLRKTPFLIYQAVFNREILGRETSQIEKSDLTNLELALQNRGLTVTSLRFCRETFRSREPLKFDLSDGKDPNPIKLLIELLNIIERFPHVIELTLPIPAVYLESQSNPDEVFLNKVTPSIIASALDKLPHLLRLHVVTHSTVLWEPLTELLKHLPKPLEKLTDLNLTGRVSVQLLKAIREKLPNLSYLSMSAYSLLFPREEPRNEAFTVIIHGLYDRNNPNLPHENILIDALFLLPKLKTLNIGQLRDRYSPLLDALKAKMPHLKVISQSDLLPE